MPGSAGWCESKYKLIWMEYMIFCQSIQTYGFRVGTEKLGILCQLVLQFCVGTEADYSCLPSVVLYLPILCTFILPSCGPLLPHSFLVQFLALWLLLILFFSSFFLKVISSSSRLQSKYLAIFFSSYFSLFCRLRYSPFKRALLGLWHESIFCMAEFQASVIDNAGFGWCYIQRNLLSHAWASLLAVL